LIREKFCHGGWLVWWWAKVRLYLSANATFQSAIICLNPRLKLNDKSLKLVSFASFDDFRKVLFNSTVINLK